MNVLEMLCHIADENSAEVKLAEKSRGRAQAASLVTSQMLEAQEWQAFKARLAQRQRIVHGHGHEARAERVQSKDADEIGEDDLDMLVVLIDVLEQRPLQTLAEVVRALQGARVLSMEFPASARQQAARLLDQLNTMDRAHQDGGGRWSLT